MQDLITNYYLISAMAAWLLAQFLKIFTGFFKEQKLSFKTLLFGTGGMPSSHTATVAALCTSCAMLFVYEKIITTTKSKMFVTS